MHKTIIASLIVTLLSTGAMVASANDKADPIGVGALVNKFDDTQDTTYFIIAIQRCTAFYMLMSRDIPRLSEVGASLYSMGFRLFEEKELSSGVKADLEEAGERYDKSVIEYGEMYGKRMRITDNKVRTGNQIAQDPWLKSDALACKKILSALNIAAEE